MFGMPFRDLCSILGLCWILYTISQVVNLYELHKEDKNSKQTFFDSAATLFSILLKIFSLPVSVVSGFLVSKFCERLTKKHHKDMNLASLKYTWKCSHCYSHAVSINRPFGYDSDSDSWIDKDYFSLHIPASLYDFKLGSRSAVIDRLTDDLFSVYCSLYPFSFSYIGLLNTYSKTVIQNENDYYIYLRDASNHFANKYIDPMIFEPTLFN